MQAGHGVIHDTITTIAFERYAAVRGHREKTIPQDGLSEAKPHRERVGQDDGFRVAKPILRVDRLTSASSTHDHERRRQHSVGWVERSETRRERGGARYETHPTNGDA